MSFVERFIIIVSLFQRVHYQRFQFFHLYRYKTDTADILGNFYARPVMGGVYAKMLLHSMYGTEI